MRWIPLILAALAAAASLGEEPPATKFVFPRIKDYGGVVALPHAAESARAGAKVVFDITIAGEPDQVHPGLERVARYLNLHALAGHGAGDVRVALVLHGQATNVSLADDDGAAEQVAEAFEAMGEHHGNKASGVETEGIAGPQQISRDGRPECDGVAFVLNDSKSDRPFAGRSSAPKAFK